MKIEFYSHRLETAHTLEGQVFAHIAWMVGLSTGMMIQQGYYRTLIGYVEMSHSAHMSPHDLKTTILSLKKRF